MAVHSRADGSTRRQRISMAGCCSVRPTATSIACAATDGALLWRFLAAQRDRRILAYEQIESCWPVHGSVLVHDGVAHFVAGRSVFVDGGMCSMAGRRPIGRDRLEDNP